MEKGALPDRARERFTRNRAFFSKLNPQIGQALQAGKPQRSDLVFEDEKCINLDLRGAVLYQPNCEEVCARQLTDLENNPERIYFEGPLNANPSPVSKGFVDKLHENYFNVKKWESAPLPIVDSGFFFLFGLGTGQIMKAILDHIHVRHVFVIEPIFEFFLQSCYAIDWPEMFFLAQKKGIEIHFFFQDKPEECVEKIEIKIQTIGNSFIEGSYFLNHYESWELKETDRIFRERVPTYFNASGFFEDELIMMRNTYLNLMHHNFRYLKRQKYLKQSYPVVVVGAGPSLDYDLAHLKKIRDQVILVSSGTALFLLLKNGLRPDYQIELENVEAVYDLLAPKAEKFGLDGITLVASASLDPRVSSLFEEVIYYARGAISSTSVFFKKSEAIDEVGPMSANTALACIATLGYRNIYLMGVDCGRFVGANHHASGSIYEDIGVDQAMETSLSFDRRVPGNFGGEVMTTANLDLSRQAITKLIRRLNLKVFNCSQGAKIDLATPLASASIQLEKNSAKRSHIKSLVRDQMPLHEAGRYLNQEEFFKIQSTLKAFREKLSVFIASQCKEPSSFYQFDLEFERFWSENWEEYGKILIIMGGTFASMIRLGNYFGTRLIDEKARQEFLQVYFQAFKEQTLWMLNIIETLYADMAQQKVEIELPENYIVQKQANLQASGVKPHGKQGDV